VSVVAFCGVTPNGIQALGTVFVVHLLLVIALWIVGRGHENDSVLDIYWGFSFVVGAWIVYAMTPAVSMRSRLVLALVTVWGARLGYHLLSRWARMHALGGDLRYQDIKVKLSRSRGYAIKSLVVVYLPMWVSYMLSQLNMLLVIGTSTQPPLSALDYAGAVIMAGAFVLEVTADLQLDAFKADPANAGKVLDTGVWAWSRHPNYFANFCCFWALFAISWQVPNLKWTVLSPLFMSWLLIGFTGKRWMDDHMKRRRPAYAAYIAHTSGFIPLPPKR
jgi:steroid 5-alpha reductase family enzyme